MVTQIAGSVKRNWVWIMDIGIDKKYIGNAIHDLVKIVGVSEEISNIRLTVEQPNHIIENVAHHLRLPVKIHVESVSSDYQPPSSSPSERNTFRSKYLVTTDSAGRGTVSIFAQVPIPPDLPVFGSTRMEGFPIEVLISEDAHHYPDVFASIMAHELSHIVLHSIFHKEKHNEVYTDLTAMLLGFSRIMKSARTNLQHGYMSDELFSHAYSQIEELRNERIQSKRRLLHLKREIDVGISHLEKLVLRFNQLMQYVDNNLREKKSKYTHEIIAFHQPGYTDKYTDQIQMAKQLTLKIQRYYAELVHYTPKVWERLQQPIREEMKVYSDLQTSLNALQGDIDVLTTYIGRVRLFWNRL